MEIVKAELPEIEKMFNDEVWYEGERRGCPVSRHDPEVQKIVADIILSGEGKRMRDMLNKR